MFPRISFLLGLGLLILITIYFAAAFLVVGPLSSVAPGWASFLAGAIVLLTVGMTVNWLSGAISTFKGVANYGATMRPGLKSYASQAALAVGHIGMACVTVNLLRNDVPASSLQLLAIAALYVAGLAMGIWEWRLHKASTGRA